jgi:hypothetical protein
VPPVAAPVSCIDAPAQIVADVAAVAVRVELTVMLTLAVAVQCPAAAELSVTVSV